MTASTEHSTTRCVACGDFYQYRDGLCWNCIKACERFARELDNTESNFPTNTERNAIMKTVLPCPFCGYDDVEINEDDEQQIAVCCPECLASGPVDEVLNGAINLWNVRGTDSLRNIKSESRDFLSQALNEGDGVCRP